jgi:hypothetical protein
LATIHPEDRTAVLQALDDATKSGRFEAKYRIIWPDGSVRRVQALGTVTATPPFNIVGASMDVT